MKSKIIGSWKLKSFTIEKNRLIRDWRKNSHGILLYTNDGHVSVSINSDFKNESDFFDSVLFYSGKFEIHENKIYHKVINATSTSRIGKIMERDFTINGDNLKVVGEGSFGIATLCWVRINL